MGLLDGYFSPQTYSGQSGGLLEMLRGAQFQNQPSQGFADQPSGSYMMGQTQVPVFGQPEPAMPTEMSAQRAMPQQAIPQPAQPQGNPFSAGLQGFVENAHTGPIGAVLGGIMGLSSGTTPRNQTVGALVKSGMDPELAKTVARDPALLRAVLPHVLGIGGKSSDISEYEYAKRQGFTGKFEDWMARKRAGAGEHGLTPIWGTDAQGNPAFIQPGKSGEAVQGKIPEGFKIARDPIKVDAGTHFILLDPQTRQPVGNVPKDIAGKERAEEIGKAQGQATVILPQTKTAVESAVRAINELRNHPGLEIGTGLSSIADPRSWIPGQPGYDFQAKNEQAQGKAFMAAREGLKGAGQVTDFEGKKGEQAIANLKTAQSKEQYLKALDELERMLQASYADLQRKAGVSGPQSEGWIDMGNGVRIRKKQ